MLKRTSIIQNLEFPNHFQTIKTGKIDCGKVYFLTMRNYVAHLTVIEMEAASFFSKNVGHTGRTQTLVLLRTNLSSKSLIYGLSTF